MRVLLVPNNANVAAVDAARSLAAWLDARGDETLLSEEDAGACGMEERGVRPGSFGPLDLVVALGGDGTILKAVHSLSDRGTPILGVNLGRLGFLCGALGSDLPGALEVALSGGAKVEPRATLRVRAFSGGRDIGTQQALNEVYAGRHPGGRAVDVAVAVDGQPLSRMVCDGMIVASPTGTTAYSLSAGGPLLSPGLRAMVIVPVAPHTLSSRPVVVPEGATVELTFPDAARANSCLVVDGEQMPCRNGLDSVEVTLDEEVISLVRVDGRDFYRALSDTFFEV